LNKVIFRVGFVGFGTPRRLSIPRFGKLAVGWKQRRGELRSRALFPTGPTGPGRAAFAFVRRARRASRVARLGFRCGLRGRRPSLPRPARRAARAHGAPPSHGRFFPRRRHPQMSILERNIRHVVPVLEVTVSPSMKQSSLADGLAMSFGSRANRS